MKLLNKQLQKKIFKTIEDYFGSRDAFSLYFLGIPKDSEFSIDIGIKCQSHLTFFDISNIEYYLNQKIHNYEFTLIHIDKLNIVIQKFFLATSSTLTNIK